MDNNDFQAPQNGGGYEQGPQQPDGNGKNWAMASFVCGLLGLVGDFVPVVQNFMLVLCILGIVFGVKARRMLPDGERGLATAGFVMGIIGVSLWALVIVCAVCAVGLFGVALSGVA